MIVLPLDTTKNETKNADPLSYCSAISGHPPKGARKIFGNPLSGGPDEFSMFSARTNVDYLYVFMFSRNSEFSMNSMSMFSSFLWLINQSMTSFWGSFLEHFGTSPRLMDMLRSSSDSEHGTPWSKDWCSGQPGCCPQ